MSERKMEVTLQDVFLLDGSDKQVLGLMVSTHSSLFVPLIPDYFPEWWKTNYIVCKYYLTQVFCRQPHTEFFDMSAEPHSIQSE